MVYALGLAAALCLALGFVLQQHAAADEPIERQLSLWLLVDLARKPSWLAGIGAMIVGQVLGAVALDHASLTVVEPLLATNLLFALPMSAAWRRKRLGRREYAGAAILIVGLAGFVAAAGTTRLRARPVALPDWIIAGASIVAVVAALTWVAKRSDLGEEATLLAIGAGLLYGLQDALTQRTLDHLDAGLGDLLTSWEPYALLAVAIVGLELAQTAFEAAPLPASLPAITIAEPLCGIGLGAGLFGQHIRLGPLYLAAELVCLVMMVLGVLLLARSPVVTGHETAGRT